MVALIQLLLPGPNVNNIFVKSQMWWW